MSCSCADGIPRHRSVLSSAPQHLRPPCSKHGHLHSPRHACNEHGHYNAGPVGGMATLVPVCVEEAPLPIRLSSALGDVESDVKSVLCAGSRAPLYRAAGRKAHGTYFWVAQLGAQLNERAIHDTGVADVCGDVIYLPSSSPPPSNPPSLRTPSKPACKGNHPEGAPLRSTLPLLSPAAVAAAEVPASKRLEEEGKARVAHCIDSLSGQELECIFTFLRFSDLSSAAAVCKTWRELIGDSQALLRDLQIRRRTFDALPALGARPRFRSTVSLLPYVLERAAEAGNVGAMVLAAEELERQGLQPKAFDWWRKAARRGHQGAQYRVGEAHYRGNEEWPQDTEEALIWLHRAAKNPCGDPAVAAAAGLLLAYMYLDGEGTHKADNTEAVKWFHFSARLGNQEAEKTLGWLWNTGQF